MEESNFLLPTHKFYINRSQTRMKNLADIILNHNYFSCSCKRSINSIVSNIFRFQYLYIAIFYIETEGTGIYISFVR